MFPFPSQILQGRSYIFLHFFFFIPSNVSWHILWHSMGFPEIKAYGNDLCAFLVKSKISRSRTERNSGTLKREKNLLQVVYYLPSNVNDCLFSQDSLLGVIWIIVFKRIFPWGKERKNYISFLSSIDEFCPIWPEVLPVLYFANVEAN